MVDADTVFLEMMNRRRIFDIQLPAEFGEFVGVILECYFFHVSPFYNAWLQSPWPLRGVFVPKEDSLLKGEKVFLLYSYR